MTTKKEQQKEYLSDLYKINDKLHQIIEETSKNRTLTSLGNEELKRSRDALSNAIYEFEKEIEGDQL